jgi:hypothetical protein
MRILISSLLLAGLAGMNEKSGAQSSGVAGGKQPFSISIRAPSKTVKSGAPVYVKVELTNTSDHEIAEGGPMYSRGLDTSYNYVCQNTSNGAPAQQDNEWKKGPGGIGERNVLKPGQKFGEVVPVSRVCNLIEPGKYLIQVTRVDPGDPKQQLVKSNTITITVTP